MESEWTEYLLGELGSFKNGANFNKNDYGDVYPVVSVKNLYRGRFVTTDDLDALKEGTISKVEEYLLKEGDIVFARSSVKRSGAGQVAIVGAAPTNCIFSGFTIRFRLKDCSDVNPKFLLYLFKSPIYRELFTRIATGTTISNLSQQVLAGIRVRLPAQSVQDIVVKKLNDLDTKIELNNETNITLEKMAQALFKSWFVDFDPVIDNALAEGKAIPNELQHRVEIRKKAHALQKQNTNVLPLPTTTQCLFPSEFEHCGDDTLGIQGWIPKGWELKPVSEAITINPKVKLSKGEVAKFADMKAMPTSGYVINDVIEKEFNGGSKFQQYDVLLARITPCLENGKTALVDFLNDDEVGFGSTEFIVLRGNKNITYPFVACLARLNSLRLHCIQNMVGSSGRQRVQNSCFDSYHLALPSCSSVLLEFERLTIPNFKKMKVNSDESNVLALTRDALLPKLISGQIRLSKEVTDE